MRAALCLAIVTWAVVKCTANLETMVFSVNFQLLDADQQVCCGRKQTGHAKPAVDKSSSAVDLYRASKNMVAKRTPSLKNTWSELQNAEVHREKTGTKTAADEFTRRGGWLG